MEVPDWAKELQEALVADTDWDRKGSVGAAPGGEVASPGKRFDFFPKTHGKQLGA